MQYNKRRCYIAPENNRLTGQLTWKPQPCQFIKSTKVLMATPQECLPGYDTPKQVLYQPLRYLGGV